MTTCLCSLILLVSIGWSFTAVAQTPPNNIEIENYRGLFRAVVEHDKSTLKQLLSSDVDIDQRDGHGRYDGTALIAAAHLGHFVIVKTLIEAGAPLDHINNLNWTAVIEAIVLGDGGQQHMATLRALVAAGANVNLADGRGSTPLQLARAWLPGNGWHPVSRRRGIAIKLQSAC